MISAALDTSSGAAFAIARDGLVLASEMRPMMGRRSDRNLVPWILEILRKHTLDVADVGEWTVGVGPGSFSGLRAGIALVKGICLHSGARCRGIPSSLALAQSVCVEVAPGDPVGVLHDARRQQAILTVYVKREGQRLTVAGEPTVLDRAGLKTACVECAILSTLHAEQIRSLLDPDLARRLRAQDGIDASHLLHAPGWPWPNPENGEANASCNPIYVRPGVFVKPAPLREVRD